jgi:hypothetical protein
LETEKVTKKELIKSSSVTPDVFPLLENPGQIRSRRHFARPIADKSYTLEDIEAFLTGFTMMSPIIEQVRGRLLYVKL